MNLKFIWQVEVKILPKFPSLCYSTSKKEFINPNKKKMAPSIPDRWIPYKACGNVIEGTRLICFKVPLRRTVQTNKAEIKEIWDVKALLSSIPNLVAVIDLTNTARYYDPRELQAAGVVHKKIFMPGRIIPPKDKVIEFMDAVDEFLGKDCDKLVGIHCTHGLNRTGYMVCRYMRDRLNIDPKVAIKRFELARGYQIERDNYIADILGKPPPPPQFGNHTKVKPIQNGDEDVEDDLPNSEKHNAHENERKGVKKKYTYNGESWRDECRQNKDANEIDDASTNGRYVKHPSYCEQDRNEGSGISRREKRRRRRQNTTHKNSTDSDRSYDYKYDY
ncbi:RNA/RNP complex-1-interacting phosphatase [Ostrinia nubilalis]|uniref:RNA/RNP complex-1-interacting phosphatase n=1 Tax=Ostrinia nubilalis TaxID=29057 RepID=UPI00308260A0